MTRRDGRRTLLVAATGGHLSELVTLQRRLPTLQQGPLWFVPESSQSTSLLQGEDLVRAPEVRPRQVRAVPAAALGVERVVREHDVDCVVSTGAGVALPAFVAARAHGIACHYVESAARLEGPSLTGRLVSALPGVHLWSQHAWSRPGRWREAPSVFDGYRPATRLESAPARLRVVVMLGTMPFEFRRLVDAVLACLPPGASVLWQTGATDVSGLHIEARPWVTANALSEAVRAADVVIAHAGVGSALTSLDGGACPILVPRRRRNAEHVDDHQAQVAQALARRGLAQAVEAADLAPHHLEAAAQWSADRVVGRHDGLSLARARRW